MFCKSTQVTVYKAVEQPLQTHELELDIVVGGDLLNEV
jgi:hypothetical protein